MPEKLIAKFRVEAIDIANLPRTARRDVRQRETSRVMTPVVYSTPVTGNLAGRQVVQLRARSRHQSIPAKFPHTWLSYHYPDAPDKL